MKRSIKNTIMILIIVCMGICAYFTTTYINKNASNMPNNIPGQMTQNGNTPPEMPSDSSNSSQNDSSSNTKDEQVPEKPNNSENSTSQNNESNVSNPPAKPDDNSNPPSGNDPNMNSNSNTNMPQIPGNMPNRNNKSNMSVIYYVIYFVEAGIISVTIVYLVMSNFNKKNFNEVFVVKDKAIILVLSTIILASILTFVLSNISADSTNTNMEQNMQNNSVTYTAVKEITENTEITEGTYTSTNKDENAVSVSGTIQVDISNITVEKSGDSEGGDSSSFYGNNSAIISKDGATTTLKNITVNTTASGANGVFSYGGSATTNNSASDGTTINISDSKITTTGDNSGGIMTTGGGTMNATNLTIDTAGTSSAAIRSDRGGGNVTVDGGTYTTTGQGSPAIYSTAKIAVSNASLISKASEGIVIEGKNSVSIDNCTLTDSNTKLNGQSTTYKNIFLYQSMSGDAAEGNAEFTAKNSNITTNNGDTLYVTNTTATINLENNNIINKDTKGNFLRIQKDSWGNSGSNGGTVTMNLTTQNAKGNIVVDAISTLAMSMKTSSYYEGTINADNTAKSITLKLDSSSKIKLTGDSYVTSLEDDDKSYSNIDLNGYKLYVNGKAI